jgi:hypothetical protein
MTLTLSSSRQFGIEIPDGGTLQWSGNGEVPETFGTTRTGAILGPLEFGIPPDGTLDVSNVQFTPGEPEEDDESSFLGVSVLTAGAGTAAATAAAAPRERADRPGLDSEVTRRSVLGLAAAIAGSLALGGTAVAQEDEQVTLTVATIDVEEVSDPYSIRVLDIVDDALPPTTELLIDQEGTRVGGIGSADERLDMQPESGKVRIYVRDSVSNFSRLLAWVRSFAEFDESIAFSRTLPADNQASDYDEETIIRLTEHPAIVEAIKSSGPEATRLTINSTEIPHVDDGPSEPGAWDILGDSFIYEVGPNPPAASEWTVETRLSYTQQLF